MENIKVDHIPKTVYDSKEDLGNNKKDHGNLDHSFLNNIKGKEFKVSKKDENQYIKAEIQKSNSKTLDSEKSYDFKSTAVNHLSYLNEISSFQSQLSKSIVSVEYSKNQKTIQKNELESVSIDKKNIDKFRQLIDLFYKSDFKIDGGPDTNALIEHKQQSRIFPDFFKKNVLITKSELFVRSFQGDHVELLENIQRQLPSSIDRIWLNGKIIWSKI